MPGNSGAIEAGRAFFQLVLNDEKLAEQLKGWTGNFSRMSGSFAKLAATAGAVSGTLSAPFIAGSRHLTGYVNQLEDSAKRVGITTEEMAQLSRAAEATGASMTSLENGLKRVSGLLVSLQGGSESTRDAFRKLGLDVGKFVGARDTLERFGLIADALERVEDKGARAGLAMSVLGRRGFELGPLLALGSQGLRQLALDLEGATASPEMIAAARKLSYEWTLMRASIATLSGEMAAAVSGPMTALLRTLTESVQAMRAFSAENPAFARALATLAGTTAAIAGLATAAAGVGFLLKGLTALGPALAVIAGQTTPLAIGLVAVTAAVAALAVAIPDLGKALGNLGVELLSGLVQTIGVLLDAIGALHEGLGQLADLLTGGLVGQGLTQFGEEMRRSAAALGEVDADQIRNVMDSLRGGGRRAGGDAGIPTLESVASIGIGGAFASQQTLGSGAGLATTNQQRALDRIVNESEKQTISLERIRQNLEKQRSF